MAITSADTRESLIQKLAQWDVEDPDGEEEEEDVVQYPGWVDQ